MDLGLLQEFEFLGRLFLAGLCGAFIGYERANRRKEAGIRTHLVVSMGSALFMIVSKYGFADMLSLQGVALDPSRIAAQIVTGVGFLGAGMIFVRGQNISGLTTAAGIWATAGIGMAVGSGLHLLGVLGTALIFVIQIFLHKHFTWLRAPSMERLCISAAAAQDWMRCARPYASASCMFPHSRLFPTKRARSSWWMRTSRCPTAMIWPTCLTC